MTEIRMKDKLFLAVVVPVAALALYWYGWRESAAKRESALKSRLSALVAEEDFPVEKARASRALASARAELAAEKGIPMPQTKVKGNPAASVSERETAFLGVLAEFDVAVLSSGGPDSLGASGGDAVRGGDEALAASGACQRPVLRAYVLEGKYPAVVKALEAVAEREMAVVPETAAMRESGRGKWTLEVWL